MAAETQTVTEGTLRVTVLSPCLIRVERSAGGVFTDEATQTVFNRAFSPTEFKRSSDAQALLITTQKATFKIPLTGKKLCCIPFGKTELIPCSNSGNLKGTARTLDGAFKSVPLSDGILSRSGVAVLDDSESLVFDKNGEIAPRPADEDDIYIFAHGLNYQSALKDFFTLTGHPPLIPRFALGNWWSRYRAYTQEEYLRLIASFKEKQIPLTVATVDMDWHWTDLNKQFGTHYPSKLWTDNPTTGGWTGYSWNNKLFPDYKAFLRTLKDSDLKVTLNLHPADGLRFFEDMYSEMCAELNLDPAQKEAIPFDITSPDFINAYFKIIHKPYERDGVDFWWIDWQQGKNTKLKGLDPLYALNHFHYLDNGKERREPLILSRYAGAGSHRYPLGFSGDTWMNWKILDFIPRFTATASNIGYTWWSHDVGGHCMGIKDDELYVRWVQFAVFNPVMRLHSTSDDLAGKEPWKCGGVAEELISEALRFRKRLIPYIYSCNYLTHTEGLPLIRPVYHAYPDVKAAYSVPNEYLFGTELIAAPVTEKTDKLLLMSKVKAYIPDGRYTDIFTGQIYKGGTMRNLYRNLTSVPVLAKEGAIIPLDTDGVSNGATLPCGLEIWIYRGTSSFTLTESNENGGFAFTRMSVSEHNSYNDAPMPTRAEQADTLIKNDVLTCTSVTEHTDTITFDIAAQDGETEITERLYTLNFRDTASYSSATVLVDGAPAEYTVSDGKITVRLPVTSALSVCLSDVLPTANPDDKEHIISVFSKAQMPTIKKRRLYRPLKPLRNDIPAFYKRAVSATRIPRELRDAFKELHVD